MTDTATIPAGTIIALAEARGMRRQQEDWFVSLPLPDYREPSPGYRFTDRDEAAAGRKAC
ncbi:MAG TPA: hypothetical protein VLT91_08610 [Rhizomicrobium sp.]|nr:hypothetical protein [Rhizomicrobium sp.]